MAKTEKGRGFACCPGGDFLGGEARKNNLTHATGKTNKPILK